MKFQHLAFLGTILSVAASHPHLHFNGHDTCPAGYAMSVYYITVTNTISSTVLEQITTSSSSSSSSFSSVVQLTSESTTSSSSIPVTVSPAPLENPQAAATSSSSISTSTRPSIETTVPETTTKAVVSSTTSAPAITESPIVIHDLAHATSSEETIAVSTSTTETTSSASTTSSPVAISSSSTSTSSSEKTSGEATYYGGNLDSGDCSFTGYTLPSGTFGTALSSAQWDISANCGVCVSIKGPDGNTLKAMIVDKCPSCAANQFDLFQDAFADLSALETGIIDIEWAYTSCDIDTPLKLKNKSGTSQWWFSMQVVNANEAVTALEVSIDSGSTWQSTTRTDYNFFEHSSGFGTETVDVRVTGKSGKVVVVKDVLVSSEAETTASSNL
ncbi:extracellular cellulase CelA/allergen Asp F7-like protein [Penicillium taxi]|uniref:extracellular cellulase CelA/allergen Asp F7-like protein n=1 Tax=Penicillium taxi TaxID=168475 RepID=UPI0025454901|nr:extracellular cellulase CelA/allergen Asp F7-like protein [Penicillium taxi]KAJ5908592.1 extracellular cellulase CelA/allergen Asp F7-like protein [Penicillium taxi]